MYLQMKKVERYSGDNLYMYIIRTKYICKDTCIHRRAYICMDRKIIVVCIYIYLEIRNQMYNLSNNK